MVPQSIQQILPPSDVVGNIRFSHPTLYVFPGGQGDSALFGINGFNLLVDGGFSRRACFWDFSRHLDRLDAVLMTRVSDDNTGGMSALLQRKTTSALYPQIGHVFANLPSKFPSPNSTAFQNNEDDSDNDNLIINVIEEGNSMLQSLQILNLQPQVCLRDKDAATRPINLYHKVGHGKLDMYVVNPARDAKDLREFMERWNGENSKTLGTFKSGINVDGKELWLPLANLVSICALLVWLPDNPDDTVTRLLFPGSTPQNKVLKGLEKLRDLDFMQKPVCASRTVQKPKQAPQKRESSKYGYRSTSRKPVIKDTVKEKSLDSVEGSKENIEKQDNNGKPETASRKSSAAQRKEEREKREEKERKRKEDKRKLLEEKEQKMIKAKEEKERAEKLRRQQEKERRQQLKEVREKLEDKSRAPRRKISEEKELKEQQNQAQATDLKGKEKTVGLKREKPIAVNRAKRNEAIKSSKAKSEQQKKQSVTADKISSLPSSKLRKDASNKTKKEEVNKSKLDNSSKAIKSKGKESEVAEPIISAVKVEQVETTGTAVVCQEKNGEAEEGVESIVEKHQIEAMETSPLEEQAPEEVQRAIEDDIEPELERIKDDEDDVNNQGLRVADIPVAEGAEQPKNEPDEVVVEPLLIKQEVPKVVSHHVKTPDEVPDLPEDEVATETLDCNIAELNDAKPSQEFEMEEKIALDLQEKELQSEKDRNEEQSEKKDVSKVVDVKNLLSPESEGAQEQKEVSEMLIRAPQVASIEEHGKQEAKEDVGKYTELEDNKTALDSVVESNNKDPNPITDDMKEEPTEEGDEVAHANTFTEKGNNTNEQTKEVVRENGVDLMTTQKSPDVVQTTVTQGDENEKEEADSIEDKINNEIKNLLSVLTTIEDICVKESNAVISQTNTDESMLKEIASAINDTHKLRDECNQFNRLKDFAEICTISDETERLVKKAVKMAIELIGENTALASVLMEDVQREADLILQCKTAKLVCTELAVNDNDEARNLDKDTNGALDIDIPTTIKELKVQESKEQASPKSETQSIISAISSNKDMEENLPNNNKASCTSVTDDLPAPEISDESTDKPKAEQEVEEQEEKPLSVQESKMVPENKTEGEENEILDDVQTTEDHIQPDISQEEKELAEEAANDILPEKDLIKESGAQEKNIDVVTHTEETIPTFAYDMCPAEEEPVLQNEVSNISESHNRKDNEVTNLQDIVAGDKSEHSNEDAEECAEGAKTPITDYISKLTSKLTEEESEIAQDASMQGIKDNDDTQNEAIETSSDVEPVIMSLEKDADKPDISEGSVEKESEEKVAAKVDELKELLNSPDASAEIVVCKTEDNTVVIKDELPEPIIEPTNDESTHEIDGKEEKEAVVEEHQMSCQEETKLESQIKLVEGNDDMIKEDENVKASDVKEVDEIPEESEEGAIIAPCVEKSSVELTSKNEDDNEATNSSVEVNDRDSNIITVDNTLTEELAVTTTEDNDIAPMEDRKDQSDDAGLPMNTSKERDSSLHEVPSDIEGGETRVLETNDDETSAQNIELSCDESAESDGKMKQDTDDSVKEVKAKASDIETSNEQKVQDSIEASTDKVPTQELNVPVTEYKEIICSAEMTIQSNTIDSKSNANEENETESKHVSSVIEDDSNEPLALISDEKDVQETEVPSDDKNYLKSTGEINVNNDVIVKENVETLVADNEGTADEEINDFNETSTDEKSIKIIDSQVTENEDITQSEETKIQPDIVEAQITEAKEHEVNINSVSSDHKEDENERFGVKEDENVAQSGEGTFNENSTLDIDSQKKEDTDGNVKDSDETQAGDVDSIVPTIQEPQSQEANVPSNNESQEPGQLETAKDNNFVESDDIAQNDNVTANIDMKDKDDDAKQEVKSESDDLETKQHIPDEPQVEIGETSSNTEVKEKICDANVVDENGVESTDTLDKNVTTDSTVNVTHVEDNVTEVELNTKAHDIVEPNNENNKDPSDIAKDNNEPDSETIETSSVKCSEAPCDENDDLDKNVTEKNKDILLDDAPIEAVEGHGSKNDGSDDPKPDNVNCVTNNTVEDNQVINTPSEKQETQEIELDHDENVTQDLNAEATDDKDLIVKKETKTTLNSDDSKTTVSCENQIENEKILTTNDTDIKDPIPLTGNEKQDDEPNKTHENVENKLEEFDIENLDENIVTLKEESEKDRKHSIVSNVSEQEIPSTSPREEFDDLPTKEDALIDVKSHSTERKLSHEKIGKEHISESAQIWFASNSAESNSPGNSEIHQEETNEIIKSNNKEIENISAPAEPECKRTPSPLNKGMSQFFENEQEEVKAASNVENLESDVIETGTEIVEAQVMEGTIDTSITAKDDDIEKTVSSNANKVDNDGVQKATGEPTAAPLLDEKDVLAEKVPITDVSEVKEDVVEVEEILEKDDKKEVSEEEANVTALEETATISSSEVSKTEPADGSCLQGNELKENITHTSDKCELLVEETPTHEDSIKRVSNDSPIAGAGIEEPLEKKLKQEESNAEMEKLEKEIDNTEKDQEHVKEVVNAALAPFSLNAGMASKDEDDSSQQKSESPIQRDDEMEDEACDDNKDILKETVAEMVVPSPQEDKKSEIDSTADKTIDIINVESEEGIEKHSSSVKETCASPSSNREDEAEAQESKSIIPNDDDIDETKTTKDSCCENSETAISAVVIEAKEGVKTSNKEDISNTLDEKPEDTASTDATVQGAKDEIDENITSTKNNDCNAVNSAPDLNSKQSIEDIEVQDPIPSKCRLETTDTVADDDIDTVNKDKEEMLDEIVSTEAEKIESSSPLKETCGDSNVDNIDVVEKDLTKDAIRENNTEFSEVESSLKISEVITKNEEKNEVELDEEEVKHHNVTDTNTSDCSGNATIGSIETVSAPVDCQSEQVPKCFVDSATNEPIKSTKGLEGLKSILLSPSKSENTNLLSEQEDVSKVNGCSETEREIGIQEVVKELTVDDENTFSFIRRLSNAISSVSDSDAVEKDSERPESQSSNAEKPNPDTETEVNKEESKDDKDPLEELIITSETLVDASAKSTDVPSPTIEQDSNDDKTTISVVPQPEDSHDSTDPNLNADLVHTIVSDGPDNITCDDTNLNGAETVDNDTDPKCENIANSDILDVEPLAFKDNNSSSLIEAIHANGVNKLDEVEDNIQNQKEDMKIVSENPDDVIEDSISNQNTSLVDSLSDNKEISSEKLPLVSSNVVKITETVETSIQPCDALQSDGPSSLVTTTVTSISSTTANAVDDDNLEKGTDGSEEFRVTERQSGDDAPDATKNEDSEKTEEFETVVPSEEHSSKPNMEVSLDTNIVITSAVITTTTNGEKVIRELSEGSDSHKLAEILDGAKETTQSVISKAEESVSDFICTSSTKTLTEVSTVSNVQLESSEKSGTGDIVQESITIVKQSVSKPASEEEEQSQQQVTTSVVSQKVVSLPSSSAVVDGSPKKDAKMTDITTFEDSTTFEEVSSKGIKIIDESLERVKVHLAKEIELEETDLSSATSFEPASTEKCVTEILEDKIEPKVEMKCKSKDATESEKNDPSPVISVKEECEANETTMDTVTKDVEDKIAKWGEPLNLPSPIPPPSHHNTRPMNNETSGKPKERSSRSDESQSPVYLDLAYVPYHGDSNYTDVEFFKRVRARYYVFSGVEPCKEVFNALLEGKKTWENKELGK